MFDMSSLLGSKIVFSDPPSDPSVHISKWLDVLKREKREFYDFVIREDLSPRWQLCFPITLSTSDQNDISTDFILSHLLIPQHEATKLQNQYISANGLFSVSVRCFKLTYQLNDEPVQKIDILEDYTLYSSHYVTVDVFFVSKPFTDDNTNINEVVDIPVLHEVKMTPLKEYRTYSQQRARESLEQTMLQLSVSTEEGQANFKHFEYQLKEKCTKFSSDLIRFYAVESQRYQKNNLSTSTPLQCLDWASKNLQLAQYHSLLTYMAYTNHGEASVSEFSSLFQPLEDYILTETYESIMKVLTQQTQQLEITFQSKIKEMRNHPLTHQPEEILPILRRLQLHEATAELKALDTERGRTPIQKLICLKKTFISLESEILELAPPQKIAPGPPPLALSRSSKQSRISVPRLPQAKRKRSITEKEHSVPEFRRLAFEQWRRRKRCVMQLVLLLLIYHSPDNLFSHLEFINFHTINDERYSALRVYYVIFKSSLQQLLDTLPRTKSRGDLSSGNDSGTISFHSFIWGFVNDQVETFPVVCESLESKQVLSIKCGDKHMVALTREGHVLTYGSGDEGQLGHGNENESNEFLEVTLLSSQAIISIDAGGTHSAAISRSGKLFCWGGNLWGQIGIGFMCESIPIPKQVEFSGLGKHQVAAVACGAAHNLALLKDGTVWSWGMGSSGRLGHGNEFSLSSPKRISAFSPHRVSDIACGWSHSICLCNDNSIYTFGHGSEGQLGHGEFSDEFEPRKVDFSFGSLLSCSAFNHTMVATTKGLFVWGWGEHGELGLGDLKSQCSPCLVEGYEIVTVSCGAYHSAATTKDGLLLTWGLSAKGQLGHGDTTTQTTPFVVEYLHNHHIIEVACGFSTTVAVQAATTSTRHVE